MAAFLLAHPYFFNLCERDLVTAPVVELAQCGPGERGRSMSTIPPWQPTPLRVPMSASDRPPELALLPGLAQSSLFDATPFLSASHQNGTFRSGEPSVRLEDYRLRRIVYSATSSSASRSGTSGNTRSAACAACA